jgi:antitoxin (DNA-binding transcriptional repressor) of toxin-antitoxin stability system
MQVTIKAAESNLAWLGKLVWEGKEIVILREGKPYLKLVPHPDGGPSDEVLPRPYGLMEGQVWISPDFDKPAVEICDPTEC